MVNKESLKVSREVKEFVEQMMINRIKLDQKPFKSYSEALETIRKHFKLNNDDYVKMLKC